MLKLIGSGLVVASCTGIGFKIAKDFRDRPRHLRALMLALRVLQAEIEYRVTPLPVALQEVADRTQRPIDVLFHEAADSLRNSNCSVPDALQRGIQACEPKSALKPQDFEVISEFAKTLGLSDRIHQTQQFEVAMSHLSNLETEARESQKRHERLWQYVGVLTGLMIVVLLF